MAKIGDVVMAVYAVAVLVFWYAFISFAIWQVLFGKAITG